MAVNLIGNLLLIVPLQHMGPPLATALASTVNVALLYRTLVARGHFTADEQLRRRAPRLLLAALAMGAVLWAGEGLLTPYVHGTWFVRFAALVALVSAGGLVYGLSALITGAFSRSDLRLLTRRRRKIDE
jgi:putative peptidoglycan lipid II flippase